jgi:hypothetical protein
MTDEPVPTPRYPLDAARQEAFLTALSRSGVVLYAARAASPHLTSHTGSVRAFRALRARDPEFAQAWDDAMDAARDELVQEAHRRAVDGWDEPVFKNGVEVGTIHKWSDRLMEVLLVSRVPEFRRDRPSVAVQVNNNTTHVPPSAPLSPADQVAFLKDYTSRLERQIGGNGS